MFNPYFDRLKGIAMVTDHQFEYLNEWIEAHAFSLICKIMHGNINSYQQIREELTVLDS